MNKNKLLISWSTGKDSAYALHKVRESSEYEVVGLISTVTEEYDRVSMHSTRHALLKNQAEQMGLPLNIVSIPAVCSNEIYEAQMRILMDKAIKQGVTHVVFGDLYLEDIRRYRESMLSAINIKPLFPLWQKDTRLLAEEMIDSGMKAIITCIDSKKLDQSFAGRQFDKAFLNDLPRDIDPCGENGEFHTFVYDGPMFSKPIPVTVGAIVKRDGFIFADVYAADEIFN